MAHGVLSLLHADKYVFTNNDCWGNIIQKVLSVVQPNTE